MYIVMDDKSLFVSFQIAGSVILIIFVKDLFIFVVILLSLKHSTRRSQTDIGMID